LIVICPFELLDSPVTKDTLVEYIETIRKHLAIDKISVLGRSMWGLFALEYAKKYLANGIPTALATKLMINIISFQSKYIEIVK